MTSQLARLFRALMGAREDAVLRALAALVACAYVLARRLGLSFSRLDGAVDQHLSANVKNEHQLETWYGDLSALKDYRDSRGR